MSEEDQIKEQQEFTEWLKDKGMYNHLETAEVMQKMHKVWKCMKEDFVSINW